MKSGGFQLEGWRRRMNLKFGGGASFFCRILSGILLLYRELEKKEPTSLSKLGRLKGRGKGEIDRGDYSPGYGSWAKDLKSRMNGKEVWVERSRSELVTLDSGWAQQVPLQCQSPARPLPVPRSSDSKSPLQYWKKESSLSTKAQAGLSNFAKLTFHLLLFVSCKN